MPSILIDARELKTSSGRYVKILLQYLQETDNQNSYSVLLKPEDFNDWQVVNNNFKKVSCPSKEFSFSEQFKLKKQIKKLAPDLVHFTFPQQPAFYKGKVVTTFHDLTTLRFSNPDKNYLIFKTKQRIYSWLLKRVAKKSMQVIVPTNYVKKDLVKFAGIPETKVSVIYEAADNILEKAEPLQELVGKRFITYVGRPLPHKNLLRLVKAFAQLKERDSDLVLALAGQEDNNYKRLKFKVEFMGISGVTFTGYVSEGQLRWLYENCAAYIFPSLSEGFGLPGLEAMAHGAPVVSSNATCLPEVYGNAAHYFNPLDVEDMIDKISEVLNNKELRDKLIKNGKGQVEKYSWESTAKQTLEIYEKALT